MRVTAGVYAILGLTVAVAEAQPPRERPAVLKPPQALTDAPPIARAVSDDLPNTSDLPSTPVARSAARTQPPGGPSWLRGVDPHVKPVAGTSTHPGNVQQLSSLPISEGHESKAELSLIQRGFEKLRSLTGNSNRPAPPLGPAVNVHPQPQPTPTATTPFRGTTANGALVYAGPPAYRWYGWGSVTPGANPAAPNGQYPKASAAWYAITGATPGAFPVPVSDSTRPAPGFDPPAYIYTPNHLPPARPMIDTTTPSGHTGYTTLPPTSQPPRAERPLPPPSTSSPSPQRIPVPESKFMPTPEMGTVQPPPVSIPKITPPPPPVPTPATIRQTPPPVPPPETTTQLPPLPAVPTPPRPTLPLVPSVEPRVALPTEQPLRETTPTEQPLRETTPTPLPATITTEPHWSPATKPATPDTWTPAGGNTPQQRQQNQRWQGSQTNPEAILVRAQQPDTPPDPIGTLIRQMCQGRATAVEIRWTGPKKLVVCFETRTADAAQKLVTDISKRPELGPYQIDFCVVVK